MNSLETAHQIHELLNSQEIMKRQRPEQPNHEYSTNYVNEFQATISKSETVGDIVTAYRKAAATYGLHSDMTEKSFRKIEIASKCKTPISDIPAVG